MTEPLVLVSIPVLTAIAVATLRDQGVAARIDRWATTLLVPAAIALGAWTGALIGLGLLTAVLAWVVASLARWSDAIVPLHARVLDQLILGGWLLVAGVPHGGSLDLALWAATALVVGLAIARDAMRSGHEAAAAGCLLLILAGLFVAATAPLLGFGCRMIGLAGLFALLPPLRLLAPLLLPGLGGGIGGAQAAILLTGGMAGLLLCAAAGLARAMPPERAAVLGQTSLAAAAIGLGTQPGAFAALILLLLLVLCEAAHTLATRAATGRSHPARPCALLALAGIPPLGTFAGLALVLPALAERSVWLVPVAGLGLAMLGWSLVRQATTRRGARSDGPGGNLAWVPLGLALALGLLMPAPLTDWLRAAAGTRPIHLADLHLADLPLAHLALAATATPPANTRAGGEPRADVSSGNPRGATP